MAPELIIDIRLITKCLQSVRENVFPNLGSMRPPAPEPTPEQRAKLDEECLQTLEQSSSGITGRIFCFLSSGQTRLDWRHVLSLYEYRLINKRLIYACLEAGIVSIFPEFSVQ